MWDRLDDRLGLAIIMGSGTLLLATKWMAYYLYFRDLARHNPTFHIGACKGAIIRSVLGLASLALLWYAWRGSKSILVTWLLLIPIRPLTWLAAIRLSSAPVVPARELIRGIVAGTVISYIADFAVFIVGAGALFLAWQP